MDLRDDPHFRELKRTVDSECKLLSICAVVEVMLVFCVAILILNRLGVCP